MENVNIKIINGYGISKLEHPFVFNGDDEHPQQNTNIIYAQNGVMKSSFAKTLRDHSKGAAIKDHIFGTSGICEINNGSAPIELDRIISVVSFDNGEFESQRMGNLLVSAELQKEYEEVMDKFKVAYYDLMDRIKDVSGVSSRDTHEAILDQICSQYGEEVPRTPAGLINILTSNRSEIESGRI